MVKALNQLLYSDVVFGGEEPAGNLRLESTSSSTKGIVQAVGTSWDLIISGQIGRFTHTNAGTQVYTFPDYSGTALISGIFTAKNQILYGMDVGLAGVLNVANGGVLSSDKLTGDLSWLLGTSGQILAIDVNGQPSFINPTYGTIHPASIANTLAYYATTGSALSPLTTSASSVLMSDAQGNLSWGRLPASYLATTGGALGNGNVGDVLTSLGNGLFNWTTLTIPAILSGKQYRIPYYSLSGSGSTLAPSAFFGVDEANSAFTLLNRGALRFYENKTYGNLYIELKSPDALAASTSYNLPAQDGTAGSLLSTDGNGNLSFIYTGRVASGLTGQVAWYAADGDIISGLTAVPNRIFVSTPSALAWSLLTPSYVNTTGNVPLAPGVARQLFLGNGAGGFIWSALLSPASLPVTQGNTLLVDNVSGQMNYATLVEMGGTLGNVAVYNADQKVTHAANLSWDDLNKLLEIKQGGSVVLDSTATPFHASLTSSVATVENVDLILPPELPAEDGLILTGNADGVLQFSIPGVSSSWEKRGVIELQPGSRSTTIVYDFPYPNGIVPAYVNIQWQIPEIGLAYLPTYGVEANTEEGFVIKFSTAIPVSAYPYKIFWESYRMGNPYATLSAYLAGGNNGAFLPNILALLCDTDTAVSLVPTITARGYCAAGASSLAGYLFGGKTATEHLATISKLVFSSSVVTDLLAGLASARQGAGGVGNRTSVFIAGGDISGTGYTSVEKFDTATESVTPSSSLPSADFVNRATATTIDKGILVRSTAVSDFCLLDYTTGTVTTPTVSNFGTPNISVGCNLTRASLGYFGKDDGSLYKYNAGTPAVTLSPVSFNSTTGFSGAVNSLSKGYFVGAKQVEALDFTTETIYSPVTLLLTGYLSASLSGNFQSKGLL